MEAKKQILEGLNEELQELEHAYADALADEEGNDFLNVLWLRIKDVREKIVRYKADNN